MPNFNASKPAGTRESCRSSPQAVIKCLGYAKPPFLVHFRAVVGDFTRSLTACDRKSSPY